MRRLGATGDLARLVGRKGVSPLPPTPPGYPSRTRPGSGPGSVAPEKPPL